MSCRLRLPLVIFVVAALAAPSARQASAPAGARKLALVGGMLLDGYEVAAAPPRGRPDRGRPDRRASARPRDVKIPPDATVIDTSGRTMLPGMIDLHAHLMILGHGNYGRWFPWIAEEHACSTQVMEISAKQLLMAGVTSAVDLGGAAEGKPRRPRPDQARRDPRAAHVDERAVDHPQRRRLCTEQLGGLDRSRRREQAAPGSRAAGQGRRRRHQGATRS